MQEEHRLETKTDTVDKKRDVAEQRDQTQPHHRAHAERGQHQGRREVSEKLEGAHGTDAWRGSMIRPRNRMAPVESSTIQNRNGRSTRNRSEERRVGKE